MGMTGHDVSAPCGALRGRADNGVSTFRNVPYAQAPAGALRFAPPQPLTPWAGVRDATGDGPVPPQGRSRLAPVTGGDVERPQSEDCLTLTLTCRSGAGSGRPVMVWIHGGGFVGGAGSDRWYTADALARRGDVIVVSLNFRQGVAGHLYLPGVSPGNLALLDIVAALQWVRANIAAFGGAADRVTLFSQSSGGVVTNALMAMPAACGLFQRAIIQSAPLGRPLRSAAEAARAGERFATILKIDPRDVGAFRRVDTAPLLAAQAELARSSKPLALGYGEPPFGPVVDGHTLMPAHQAWGHARETGIDLLIGTTRDEQAAQFFVDPGVQNATAEQAADVIAHFARDTRTVVLEYYRQRRPTSKPAELLCDFYTDLVFRLPALRLAEQRAGVGLHSWVYQFDWASPAGFGACHCLDLAFIFGSLEAYEDAPMLRGIEPSAFRALSDRMQDAWLGFARGGMPGSEHLPAWPAYEMARRMTMTFDERITCSSDPTGFASHPVKSVLL